MEIRTHAHVTHTHTEALPLIFLLNRRHGKGRYKYSCLHIHIHTNTHTHTFSNMFHTMRNFHLMFFSKNMKVNLIEVLHVSPWFASLNLLRPPGYFNNKVLNMLIAPPKGLICISEVYTLFWNCNIGIASNLAFIIFHDNLIQRKPIKYPCEITDLGTFEELMENLLAFLAFGSIYHWSWWLCICS